MGEPVRAVIPDDRDSLISQRRFALRQETDDSPAFGRDAHAQPVERTLVACKAVLFGWRRRARTSRRFARLIGSMASRLPEAAHTECR